jgi:WD40 repeat protein
VASGRVRATLRQAADPKAEVLHGAHEGHAYAVAFSPCGKTLASGSSDRTIKLWDVATGEEKATLQDAVFVRSVAFSPDGKLLASGGGVTPATFDSTLDLTTPRFKIHGEVKVWDLDAGKARTFFHGPTGQGMSVAFSPDGRTLAAGMWDGAIRLWDVAAGKERACLRGNADPVLAVAFGPDGKTLASGGDGAAVQLWDLASGRVRARLRGHTCYVTAVAFSPDGRTLATTGSVHPREPGRWYDATGEVRLWDVATCRPCGAPLTFLHYGSSVAFGPRGKILAAGGTRGSQASLGGGRGEITLWDLDPGSASAP